MCFVLQWWTTWHYFCSIKQWSETCWCSSSQNTFQREAQRNLKATKNNLMRNKIRKTWHRQFIRLIPLSNPSPEMQDSPDQQLKALYHQLPFPSSWLHAPAARLTAGLDDDTVYPSSHPSPRTSCFIITLFDKPFVFFYVPHGALLSHEPHQIMTVRHQPCNENTGMGHEAR